jgi:hypothetical protein
MNNHTNRKESGQSLVIIALGIIAFVAILALVVDGANAYAARRQAQNAADAGALAGAEYMCKNHDQAGAITQAEDYAINKNGAASADVKASLSAGTVVVTATVDRPTFFAGVLGFLNVTPRAVAAAECRPPIGMGVLPIAWSCRENTGSLPGEDCVQKIYPECSNNPYDKNCTYIIMDSKKSEDDVECAANVPDPKNPGKCIPLKSDIDGGKIACDTNADCIDELITGGARSWLDLDGGGNGASDLWGVMCGDISIPPIIPHTWEPSKNGVSTSVFDKGGACVLGKDNILPVFNEICKGIPNIFNNPETNDYCTYGPLDDLSLAKSFTNYHIITFSEFHVTCYQTNKKNAEAEAGYQWIDKNHQVCNGHQWAVDIGGIADKDKTIEGYFIKLDLGGYGGPGSLFDAGTFTVVLTK